ncbi:MAG: DUF4105 domain-containing protein [Oligoflexia bacterium]|nr:DUF4105 domain-containing protein [Oligoflexia bacterium]
MPLYANTEGKFGLVLKLNKDQQTNKLDTDVLKEFISDVEKSIPLSMKSLINHPIEVTFAKLDSKNELGVRDIIKDNSQISVNNFKTTTKNLYGKTDRRSQTIKLNKNFIPEILLKDKSRSFAYAHKNFYTKARATLIHEITHIFLYKLNKLKKDLSIKNFQDESDNDKDDNNDNNENIKCNSDNRNKDDSTLKQKLQQYRHILNWHKGKLKKITQSNTNVGSSPDPYEFSSYDESMPVNMEFFLLDPEFKCRRPAVYLWLKNFLNYQPFVTNNNDNVCAENCEPTTTARISTNLSPFAYKTDMAKIDPKRVYQIHYLLAGIGKSFESKWGHVMFRIVICSEKTDFGPKCLDDINDHLVLSYAAEIPAGATSALKYLKAITTGLPSKAFLKRFTEVLEDNTIRQNREIKSVPLKINDDQKKMIIYKMFEDLYQYQGRYDILKENCTTMSDTLLKSAITNYNGKEANTLKPTTLFSELSDLKLIDPKVLESELHEGEVAGLQKHYYFNSAKNMFQEELIKIKKLLTSFSLTSLDDYYSMTADERLKLFQDTMDEILKNKDIKLSEKYRMFIYFNTWENNYLKLSKIFLHKTISKIINHYNIPLDLSLIENKIVKKSLKNKLAQLKKEEGYDLKLHELVNKFQELSSQVAKEQRWPRYGVPTKSELAFNKNILNKSLQSSLLQISQELMKQLNQNLKEELQDIFLSQKNVNLINKTFKEFTLK